MGIEIERKFLVNKKEWDKVEFGSDNGYISFVQIIDQGYLSTDQNRTVRVRIQDSWAFITIKGKSKGISRSEWEWPIDIYQAKEMMELCINKISKNRYIVWFNHKKWEVDVFCNELEGLIIAECELKKEDEDISLPPWVGKEVSDDPRYFNSNLLNLTENMFT